MEVPGLPWMWVHPGAAPQALFWQKHYNDDDDDEMMMNICTPCNKWNRCLNLWMVSQIGDVLQTSLHLFAFIIKIILLPHTMVNVLLLSLSSRLSRCHRTLWTTSTQTFASWSLALACEDSSICVNCEYKSSTWKPKKGLLTVLHKKGTLLDPNLEYPCPLSTSVGLKVLLRFFGIL